MNTARAVNGIRPRSKVLTFDGPASGDSFGD
ncbi:MAG: hypothetical protein RL628_489 [Actinomycetota bacterium]